MSFFDKFKDKKEEAEKAVLSLVGAKPVNQGILGLKEKFRARLRKFDIARFLRRQERIGGLLIQEEGIGLVVFDKIREDGVEKMTILLHQFVPLEAGVILEGKILKPEVLRSSMTSLYKEATKASLESIILSVPSSLAQFSGLTFPTHLSRSEIDDAVRLAAESSFPLPTEKLYFDWVMPEAEHYAFQKQEVIVGFAEKNDINSYVDVVYQSGFSPVAVETHSMSVARLFPLATKARLVLFIEPSEVLAVVYDSGLPHLQFQIPKSVLEEGGGNEDAILEKMAELCSHLIHSTASGDEHIVVKDIMVIPEDERSEKLRVLFEKKKLPKFISPKEGFSFPVTPDTSERDKLRGGLLVTSMGAALRGLLPRKLDTLISFMDIGTELAYERARLVSLVDLLQKFAMIFGGFMVAVFAAGLLFVNTLGRGAGEAVKEQASLPSEFTVVRDAALSFNQTVAAISEINQHMPRWEALFQAIDGLGNIGIIFRQIDVRPGDKITVGGMARNRDALLLLKSTAEQSPVFSVDPLPLPLLLAGENTAFTLKLQLKESKKFFP